MTLSIVVRVRRVYGVLLSISLVLAGVCLAAGAIVIYTSAPEEPYSREIVGDTLWAIAAPLILSVLLTVGGFVLDTLLPPIPQTVRKTIPSATVLSRLTAKKTLDGAEAETVSAIRKENRARMRRRYVQIALCAFAIAVFAAYALTPSHFPSSESAVLYASMIRAMCWLTPCFLVPAAFAVYAAYADERSLKREIALWKMLPAAGEPTAEPSGNDRKAVATVARIVLLVVAVAAITVGVLLGGTADVFTKAANICTECIGLG